MREGTLDPIALGLPHRPPFLCLDTVMALEPGVRGEALWRLPTSTPFFAGHFPGKPMVPGVLLTEAIAQLSGIVAAREGRSFLLTAIRSMKFPASAGPEEEIHLFAQVEADHGALVHCSGEARVGDRVVAVGSVVLAATQGEAFP